MDLNELDLPELKKLQRDVTKAIDTYEQRQRAAALAEVEKVAAAHGMKLHELVGGAPIRKPVAAKYRHPENPELTWTGRGRKPRWIAEALEAGKSLDDFAI